MSREQLTEERKQQQRWRSLLPVIADHTEWFNAVTLNLFYTEKSDMKVSVNKPLSFSEWTTHAQSEGILQPELLEKLVVLHKDMFEASDKLLSETKSVNVKPEFDDYQAFINIYEQFLQKIRRLERDFMLDGTGYDPFTGLRSPKVLHRDVDRELQRLARRGQNFCIALGRIDNHEKVIESYSQEGAKTYVKAVADLIKLSVRTFDDAYYMGDLEFVLSLKQADMAGGISALDRLRKSLEQKNILLNLDGKKVPLSMSCCIAQPVQGDNVSELLTNLRNDLNSADRTSDTVLEYYEISPLQRYVQETSQ